jgi:hypothetical protein
MTNLKNKLAQKIEIIEPSNTVNESNSNNNEIITHPSQNVIVLRQQDNNECVSVIPDFVVTLEQAKQRLSMLKEFVKDMMIPGVDYGLIPKCEKPTLFKSGAEKLTDIFGFSKQFEITNRVEDWDKVLFHYEVKSILINKRTGLIEAEGLGCCNNRERKYKTQDGFSLVNTILKMAKKRALVDAVLSATRSSGIFTQDIEDADNNSYAQHNNNLSTIPTQSTSDNSYYNSKESTPIPLISKSQHTQLISILTQRSLPIEEIRIIMNERYKVNESKYLNNEQATDFIGFLKLYNAI